MNTSILIPPVSHFVYPLLLVKEHTSISELIRTRSEFLALLTGTLELELRLLHSTEADPKIIAREHGAFAELLDRLAAHPQIPMCNSSRT